MLLLWCGPPYVEPPLSVVVFGWGSDVSGKQGLKVIPAK